MNIILLSGGSGRRLWPLSNDIRSKQFIKIFRNENDEYESMVQRMYRQIMKICPDAHITIATSGTQVSSLKNQLGADVDISLEPCRKDTFPAIALATSYLRDKKGVGENESVVVCPVDPYVESDYFEMLYQLGERAEHSDANLVLMGIEPTYPSEKYGYIIPEQGCIAGGIAKVKTFKEKPTKQLAQEYISAGALWNGGVFSYKLGYVLEKTKEILGYSDYESIFSNYETLDKISFDYAVVEKEIQIEVMSFSGTWKDLGTWNTLASAMDESIIGNAITNDTCEDVNIINELDIPILAMGIKNAVISASPDGIIVSDKEQSSYIKPYVDNLVQPVMYAEKSWGTYKVLDVEEDSFTMKITLMSGSHFKYHSHELRDEVWTIVSGRGTAVVDDSVFDVKPGDVVTMRAGSKHTLIAKTELTVIEVQSGKDISVSDKIVYEWNFEDKNNHE